MTKGCYYCDAIKKNVFRIGAWNAMFVSIAEDILSIMSNPQPNCCLKVDFQKVDQHAVGTWLIHNTKRRMDNQLQS